MKTLARIVIILAVFALVMGVTYIAVNAAGSGTSANAPQFDRPGFGEGDRPALPNGERPEFPGGERNEFRGEGGGFGWIFGLIKNTVVIGIIVVLIVLPKSWMQRNKRTAPAVSE